MMRSRANPGDVLEIVSNQGIIYVQCLGKHSEYGDAILVSPQIVAEKKQITHLLFSNAYVAFYPVTAALGKSLAVIAGKLPHPVIPSKLRRPGMRSGTKVETWIIEETFQKEKIVKTLSLEDMQLPVAVIWNHEMLFQRVSEGWRPEKDPEHE